MTVLALVTLFTENNYFWIAALLLAAVRLPDHHTPLNSMVESMRAERQRTPDPTPAPVAKEDDNA